MPLTVEPRIVSVPPKATQTPAPSASLVVPPAERFPDTVVRRRVTLPSSPIPPPAASANGQGTSPGQGGPIGSDEVGVTWLPEITLSLTVSVAPGALLAAKGT